MQKRLARELTVMVHSEEDLANAEAASRILFSNDSADALHSLDEKTLLEVFEGVPTFEIDLTALEGGIPLLELLATHTKVFPSKGEARKMTQQGGVSLNKQKVADPAMTVGADFLLNGKYILAQRGKKNYYLIIAK